MTEKSGQMTPLKMCFLSISITKGGGDDRQRMVPVEIADIVNQGGKLPDVIQMGVGEQDILNTGLLFECQGRRHRSGIEQGLRVDQKTRKAVSGDL